MRFNPLLSDLSARITTYTIEIRCRLFGSRRSARSNSSAGAWCRAGRRAKTEVFKIPFYFTQADRELLSFVVYMSTGSDRNSPSTALRSIITDANETMSKLHDWKPVILLLNEVDEWLNPERQDIAAYSSCYITISMAR